MPKLHIIYDPTDKIEVTRLPEEIKCTVMPVSEDVTKDELQEIIKQLTNLLLEQMLQL